MPTRDFYQPLDHAKQEVRLLDILPFSGRPDDLVACRLRVVSLQDEPTPSYQTISYCWGDPSPCCSIILNGKNFMVPRATELVLRRVSDQHNERTVWIDAVGINQADFQERAEQVMLMGEIYFSTSGGIVYLGQGEHDSARALANLAELAREAEGVAKTPRDLGYVLVPRGDFARATDDSRLRVNLDVDALARFFALLWLRRVWVIQEAVLPTQNECLLGDSKISIDDLLIGCAWLLYHQTYLPSELMNDLGLAAMQSMWRLKFLRDVVISMLDDRRKVVFTGEKLGILVLNIRGSSTSDERDRVFGLLGLAKRDQPLSDLIRPDYTKSLAEVMRDATRYFITVEALLGFYVVPHISHRSHEDITELGWPSWVPRIHRANLLQDPHGLQSYSMKGSSEGVISCDSSILRLKGYAVGVIGFITPEVLLESDLTPHNVQQALRSINQFVDLSKTATNIALRRTLLADIDFALERCSAASYTDFDAFLAYFTEGQNPGIDREAITFSGYGKLHPTSQDPGMKFSRYLVAMIRACEYRKFARTWMGHYALVPRVCQARDVIVMVPGCRTPVVIRPLENEDGNGEVEQYLMLGECYLDGHMWPEDVERVKNSDCTLYHWDIV